MFASRYADATSWKFRSFWASRVNACTTRMPAMSSASVAVTSPSRSRTWRYARADPAGEVRLRRRECDRADAGDDEERDDSPEHARIVREDAAVDREFREVGRCERDRGREQQKEDREPGTRLVRRRQPRERRDAPSGRAPRPVLDLAA